MRSTELGERMSSATRIESNQRVDRLFGQRRRVRVDDAAIHRMAHQHGQRQQREERRSGLHHEPRPSGGRTSELPGGKTEGERRYAVAGQQSVEDRRPAKHEVADDRRVEHDAPEHHQHRTDR
jgi:hypothetical protein